MFLLAGIQHHHVQMDADQSRLRLVVEPGRHRRAPVATSRRQPVLAEALNQDGPGIGNAVHGPAACRGPAGKAEARLPRIKRESILGAIAMRDRIGQLADQIEEFQHRARPPVRYEQRHRIRPQ